MHRPASNGYGFSTNQYEDNGNSEKEFLRTVRGEKQRKGNAFYFYMEDAKKIPLLNTNAENELGCLIWQSREILATCEQYGLDPAGNIENLLSESREILTLSNLRLVISIALRYRDTHLQLLDFVQRGNIGLMKAVNRFDYQRKTRFSTYATPKIRQSILSAFPTAKPIKIPLHVDEAMRKITNFSKEFMVNRGRFPSDDEIAEELNLAVDLIREYREIKDWKFSSIEENPIESEYGYQLADILTDKDTLSPEDNAYQAHRRNAIGNIIAGIPKILGETLKSRLGFYGKEETLEAIGKKIRKTREWARQLEKKGLGRLKNSSRKPVLEQFYDES